MAVENKWVNSDVEAGKKANPGLVMPGQIFGFACTFEVAAADDDGSVYKLAKVGANMIPLQIWINCDSIAGSTVWDLGFYKEDGSEADKDILMSNIDLNAGKAMGSEQNGLVTLPIDKVGSKVYELLGLTVATRSQDAYVLALTGDTVGSAAGTISVRGLFIQG